MAFVLPKQAFVALAAVGWADGSIRRVEKAGLLRAAEACGVAGEDLVEVEASLAKSVSLADWVPGEMAEWQRIVTYALACWLAQVDGVISADEHAHLASLAKRLDIQAQVRDRAAAAAFDVFVLPQGGKPDKYDFVALEARLRERLPTAASKAS